MIFFSEDNFIYIYWRYFHLQIKGFKSFFKYELGDMVGSVTPIWKHGSKEWLIFQKTNISNISKTAYVIRNSRGCAFDVHRSLLGILIRFIVDKWVLDKVKSLGRMDVFEIVFSKIKLVE